jgi:hypothetical protein
MGSLAGVSAELPPDGPDPAPARPAPRLLAFAGAACGNAVLVTASSVASVRRGRVHPRAQLMTA